MTALHHPLEPTRYQRASNSFRHAVKDIVQGFFEISHHSVALLGLALAFALVMLAARPDLRQTGESQLISWLEQRREAAVGYVEPIEPTAIDRATASNPKDLPNQQAAVAYWLSKKYGVAPEPLSVLVAEAFAIGQKTKLDPTLILAVMAIESGFNPFAQSPVGAQGLMQVMTRVHHDKYDSFGGKLAAFDPVSNLRVGVKVLQECIARAGSVQGGLKYYVGAANLPSDGGYANKVMAEHARLLAVAGGKRAPSTPYFAAPGNATTQPIPVALPPSLVAPAPVRDSEQMASL